MKLSHFTHNEITAILDAEQDPERAAMGKPVGFWVSVDGPMDWDEWCRDNTGWTDKAMRYRIELDPDAKILRLETEAALRAFSSKYERQSHYSFDSIDWPRVTAEYDGIIIAPYQYGCRFDLSWYYAWDCASGCIWNASAIKTYAKIIDHHILNTARSA